MSTGTSIDSFIDAAPREMMVKQLESDAEVVSIGSDDNASTVGSKEGAMEKVLTASVAASSPPPMKPREVLLAGEEYYDQIVELLTQS